MQISDNIILNIYADMIWHSLRKSFINNCNKAVKAAAECHRLETSSAVEVLQILVLCLRDPLILIGQVISLCNAAEKSNRTETSFLLDLCSKRT